MHSVCRCSLLVWRRSFLKKGTPRDLFLPRPGCAPGRIWPKNNSTCKGTMTTSCILSFIKIHQAVLEKKLKMWKFRDDDGTPDGRTDDGRCAMTIKKLVELQGCEYMLAVKFINVSVLLYKCIFNDIKQPWKCHELHLRIISFILANSSSFLNEISFIFHLWGWHLSYAKFPRTRHVFVKHGCPRRQQSQTMAKISKSYILTLPHPQGHMMSVKCNP